MRKILFERISGSLSGNWKSKIQNRKWLTLSVIAFVIMTACAAIAQAQQTGKVPHIGYLFNTTPSVAALRVEAFRQGLRELGYVEGKNIVLESGYSEGKIDRLHALVAEFVRLKTEVIVTSGPIVTRAAKEATKTIPIVFAQEGDPVARGFVTSLHGLAETLLACPLSGRS
jgi:putative ABC transport system substrate-binding protein